MQLLPPLSPEAAAKRLGSVISPINRGLSVKVFGVPGSGKTSAFTWLINNLPLQKQLGISEKIKPVYLDLDQTVSTFGQKLVRQQIETFCQKNDQGRVVLVLDAALNLIENEEIRTLLARKFLEKRPNLSFVFLATTYFRDSYLVRKMPLLKIPLGEAKAFFPLFDKKETGFALDQWEKVLGRSFTSPERVKIFDLSGGWVEMVKKLAFWINDNPKKTLSVKTAEVSPEIMAAFNRLFEALTDKQRQIINQVRDGKSQAVTDWRGLDKLGIASKKNKLFSPLFDQFIRLKRKRRVRFGSFALTDDLTASELGFLKILDKNRGEIVDRDTIARAIWGHLWREKYSDWAIDKIASQTRKKIGKKENRKKLVTLRGRGFRLTE